MIKFPVAVVINGNVQCIEHVEKADDMLYCGICKYSGYEVYFNEKDNKFYATNIKKKGW